ncbi:hypothetical protein RchiOBHm_Chr5g0078691 [Rosa chinensis]|uniref:Secreted protein n=1 Tax=Rosa chinensis TaxID=74649 RepID=A0A2P6QMC4_ROSCH|nr:hypothetical protein RchiOBHm_Chr5g0078691 [Rosa chinensis]
MGGGHGSSLLFFFVSTVSNWGSNSACITGGVRLTPDPKKGKTDFTAGWSTWQARAMPISS